MLRLVPEAKDCPPDYDEGLFIEVQTVKRIKANLNGRRTVPERTSKYRRNHFPRYFFVSREKRREDEQSKRGYPHRGRKKRSDVCGDRKKNEDLPGLALSGHGAEANSGDAETDQYCD